MNLLSLYLADLNGLTRRDRWHLTWYAAIIFPPLVLAFLAWLRFGPSLTQVLARRST
jgi:hypothetical protein